MKTNTEVTVIKKDWHPRDAKIELAKEIITRFHSLAEANAAETDFITRFREHAMPEEIPEVTITCGHSGIAIANLLKEAGLTATTSEAIRMIQQGAVRIDGERIHSKDLIIKPNTQQIFQVGRRRFMKVQTK